MAVLAFGGVIIPATQWMAAGIISAAIYTTLIARIFAHRNQRKAADQGRLFLAVYVAAFAGISLLIINRSLALVTPLVLAPIPILYLLFYYAFPDPTYMPRWARWLGILLAISFAASFSPQRQSSNAAASALSHLPLLLGLLTTLADVLSVLAILVGIVPQLYYRYLHFSVTGERLRPAPGFAFLPGMAFGVASVVVLLGEVALLQVVPGHSSAWLLAVTVVLYVVITLGPIAMAFALLDRRPYDHEALVNRLFIYGLLTACLMAIYAGSILALWYLFPGFGRFASYAYIPFFILIGLLMASAFQPLREQLWQHVDRRFYPHLYNARVRVTSFTSTLSGEIPLDMLCRRLTGVVQESLAPSWVQMWIPHPALQDSPKARPSDNGADGASGEAVQIQLRAQIDDGADPLGGRNALAIHSDDSALEALLRPSSVLVVNRQPSSSAIMQEMHAAGTYMVLPLVRGGELVGLLALGPRASSAAGRQYSSDDCRQLTMLVDAASPTLRRALVASAEALETRRRERVEQELRTARLIQEAMLPKTVPALHGWSIATSYQPAREVGGDFYDFLPLASGRLGIILGDVTGKGIPAALVMANTRSMLRAVAAQPWVSPGRVLAQVNELLCADLPPGMFVTCFYAILDPVSGEVHYANAGQDLPYLRQEGGVTGELRATGMPLGLMPGSDYSEGDSLLLPGNSLLFYSDGLIEAHSPEREMFGRKRLAELLGRSSVATSPIPLLLDELAHFTGDGWEQEDDITLVVLQREQSAGEEIG